MSCIGTPEPKLCLTESARLHVLRKFWIHQGTTYPPKPFRRLPQRSCQDCPRREQRTHRDEKSQYENHAPDGGKRLPPIQVAAAEVVRVGHDDGLGAIVVVHDEVVGHIEGQGVPCTQTVIDPGWDGSSENE